MLGPKPTPVRCSSCGQPNQIDIRTVIDINHDPEGKVLLVSGVLNSYTCPQCGTQNDVKTPVLYHDAEKEMLIAFVPQELAMQQNVDEEKLIGDMLNELTTALPKEDFRGYMFNPKRTLSMQGLINQILEADGITPEMIQEQQRHVDLIQTLIESESDQRIATIQAHDADINDAFFATFAAMATRLSQDGQQQLFALLEQVQRDILAHSTFGKGIAEQQQRQQQTIETVTRDIEALGEDAEHKDFIELLWSYRDNDEKVQALVGLIRPLFDYQFFQLLTTQIGKAPDGDREKLEALRDRVHELSQSIDQQSRDMMQQLAKILQTIVNSPNAEQLIRDNIGIIDDNFMMIVQVNMQQAQEKGDEATFKRLQEIHEILVSVLREHMQPELRLINDLMGIEDDNELIAELERQAPQYKDTLRDVVDSVLQVVISQRQPAVIQRVEFIKQAVDSILT